MDNVQNRKGGGLVCYATYKICYNTKNYYQMK